MTDIELTEDHMNDLARYCLDNGMDPTSERFMRHIAKCNCITCKGALVLVLLVGDRMKAMIEGQSAHKH